MKTITNIKAFVSISLIIAILFFANLSIGQCPISNLYVEAHSCVGNTYSIDLDFDYGAITTNMYDVKVDGVSYGFYSDLPNPIVTIDGIQNPNGDTVEVEVCSFDPYCFNCDWFNLITPICDTSNCNLTIALPLILPATCGNDGNFDFEIVFDITNGNNSGFDVFVNGDFFEYFPNYPQSGDLVFLEDLAIGNGQNIELLIADNDNVNCADIYNFTAPNCDTTACQISIPITEVYCSGDTTFIDFEVENTNATSTNFSVNFAGNFIQSFPFGETFYTIEIPNNAAQTAGLYIYDNDDLNCFYEVQVTLPNCDTSCCQIIIPITEVYCQGNLTFIDFEVENFNTISDTFLVQFDGNLIAEFPFGETFYTIEVPNNAAQTTTLFIVDNIDYCCNGITSVTLPNCTEDCFISNPEIILIECIDSANVEIIIDFDFENEGTMGFNISNLDVATSFFGGTGNYNFADLPITLGPFAADGFTTYEIEITDNEFNTNCQTVLSTPAISCLFPGNADGDSEFKVNNCDVLNIGLAYGLTGEANVDFIESNFNAATFDPVLITSQDLEFLYADCDGNGIIDIYDIDVINQNYTFSSDINVVTNFSANGIPLYVDLPITPIASSTALTIPIVLGDLTSAANNFYGLAFSINYDTALVQNNSVTLDFANGWFLDGAINPITYINVFEDFGRIDIALSLTNIATSTSGNGPIGEISIVLIEDIEGGIANPNLEFIVSNVKGISNQNDNYEFSTVERLAPIYANIDDNNSLPDYFSVFPNPVLDKLFIENNANHKIEINLINSLGQIIYTASKTESHTINCENFESGNYVLRLIENKKTYFKRIIIE